MKHMNILVIEDEFVVALDLIDSLLRAGFGNVIHAETETTALRQLEQGQWDAVVADANLNGKSIAQVGDTLLARGIPFVIVTGYDREHLPLQIRDAPLLGKPVSGDQLAHTVMRLCGLWL
jgi:CheY-like chemotaxis protein